MSRIRVLLIGGLAWSGVVVGHLAAYLVAYPAEAERATRLAETGHGSFPLLLVSALALIPAILSLMAVQVMRGDRPPSFVSTALWLAGIQVLAFLAMEFFERGMSLHTPLEPAFQAGLVIQLLVAAVSALLVRTFFRVLRTLVSRWSDVPKPVLVELLTPATDAPPSHFDFLVCAQRRAPPLLRIS